MISETSSSLLKCDVSGCKYPPTCKATDCGHFFCGYHVTQISRENERLICPVVGQVIEDSFQSLKNPSEHKTLEMIKRDIRVLKAVTNGCMCCCCFLGVLGTVIMSLK